MEKNTTVYGGTSIVTLLQVAFIVLKLCKVITWKWFYVMLPTIISAGLAVGILLLVIVVSIISSLVESRR